jgi:hypothetical protein
MPYIGLPDPAESGESDHIGDHNTIVNAVAELQTNDATHVTTIVAGTNTTVSRTGQSVTINSATAANHTHPTMDATDVSLQSQIDAVETAIVNPLAIAAMPAGTAIYVDQARTAWSNGTTRPTNRSDITVIWKGSTDPSQLDPNPVGPYDIWYQTTA